MRLHKFGIDAGDWSYEGFFNNYKMVNNVEHHKRLQWHKELCWQQEEHDQHISTRFDAILDHQLCKERVYFFKFLILF